MSDNNGFIKQTAYKKQIVSNVKNKMLNFEDLGIDQTFYFLNIENCNININCKINNIYLEECRNVNIFYKTVVNKVDIYNCENIYLKCKHETNLIVTEKCGKIVSHFDEDVENLNFVVSNTYNITCYCNKVGRYVNVKFSMFKDRYKTSFHKINGCYKSIFSEYSNEKYLF